MKKQDKIKSFLEILKKQSKNVSFEGDDVDDIKELFDKHFQLVCKKCGSTDIFINSEEGIDYGGMTGYSPGQKLFKCKSCGNAYSYYK